MPGTPGPRTGLSQVIPTDGVTGLRTTIDAIRDWVEANGAIFSAGTLAARPVSTPGSPGKAGRFYFATDERDGVLYLDLGTGWVSVMPGTGPVTTLDLAGGGQTPLAFTGDVDTAKWLTGMGGFSWRLLSDNANTVSTGSGDKTYKGRTYRPKLDIYPSGDLYIAGMLRSARGYNARSFAYNRNAVQSGASGTWANNVDFAIVEWDDNSPDLLTIGGGSGGRITPSTPGKWHISAGVRQSSVAAAGQMFGIAIYKNGSLHRRGSMANSGTTNLSDQMVSVVSADVRVDGVSDFIEIRYFQDSGSNKNLGSTSAGDCYVTGHYHGDV